MNLRERTSHANMIPAYSFESGCLVINNVLSQPGIEIARKKREDKIRYKEIDPKIRTLIRLLNQLPFIATHACCQGHSYERHDKALLNSNQRFLRGGTLFFLFDPRVADCHTFFEQIEDTLPEFPFVVVELREPDIDSYSSQYVDRFGLPGCVMAFNLGEFHHKDYVSPYRGAVVDRDIAEARLIQYDRFWSTMLNITAQFIPKNHNVTSEL